LIRSPRGVNLTEAGLRLLARANLVTRQLDLADQELRDAGGHQSGQVRVALTPYVTLKYLGQAFLWFRQRYPKVALELVEGLVSRALPRLRDGTMDLAIVADTGDLPIGEFHVQEVLTTQQYLVVRQGHPVLAEPTPQALAGLEWVLTGPRDGLKSSRLKAVFARAGVTPPEHILFCETLAGMALLRSTDVAGVMPAPLMDLPEGRGMVTLEVPGLDPGELKLVLLTRPDVPLSPAAEYFAQCLMDASRQQAAH
jgi:LysR family transcriptional regulator, regulator of abg operon